MAVFRRDARAPRHSTRYEAWITLDGGFAKRKCTILNLSASGACLQVRDLGAITDRLDLALTADVRKVTRCRLIWREGPIIGVEFMERT